MNNVACLTEKEIHILEEQNKRKIVLEQKKNLIKYMSKKARRINGHLHQKTYDKAAVSLLMKDTKVMSLTPSSSTFLK